MRFGEAGRLAESARCDHVKVYVIMAKSTKKANTVVIPETSTTLLRDIAQDSQHARWAEFVARYRPMMEAYMRERFPSVEADDAIQETLIALIETFPVYHYSPDEKGSFHNYLTGILRNKALRLLHKEERQKEIVAGRAVSMKPPYADGRAACPHAADDMGS